jgi:hypothetical protein
VAHPHTWGCATYFASISLSQGFRPVFSVGCSHEHKTSHFSLISGIFDSIPVNMD